MAPSITVEVRGWQGPRSDGERCLFSTLRGLLGCDDAQARRLAYQFGEQGSVVIDAKSRESAEGLSEYLQGLGALICLAPREGPVTSIEAHVAAWGTLRDDRATCQRVTSSKFHVTFYAPTIDYISGETTARPACTESFSLGGVSASCIKVIDESEDGALLDVELVQPLRPVAFVPDRTLCRPGGIGLEAAMRLVRRQIIANWISEDLDYWYFHFLDGGAGSWHFTQPEGPNPPHEYLVPNCYRISKQDGVCARISRALPA